MQPNQIVVKEYQDSGYFIHIRPTRMGGWIGSVLDKDKKPLRSLISHSEHSALLECKMHVMDLTEAPPVENQDPVGNSEHNS